MATNPNTVVMDACVLYPAPLRDLLLSLTSAGLYQARWTRMIEDEWITSLLFKRPDLEPQALRRTAELMKSAVGGCYSASTIKKPNQDCAGTGDHI